MFPPERIVCLTEGTVETLYLLGEERRIVGISGYVVRPPSSRRPAMDHRHGALAGARDRGRYRDGRHAGAGSAVAEHAPPTGRSALCRPHWLARREREEMPGRKGWPDRAMLGFDEA